MARSSPLKTQQMQVSGMDCTNCKMKIEGSLERLKGVAEASVTVATGRLTVTYNPEQVSEATIQERIKALGYTLADPKSSVALNGREHHHFHAEGHNHDETHSHHEHDEDEGHDHGHSHGSGEFNLKQELPPVLIATITLFAIAILFEEPLHNTPYHRMAISQTPPAKLVA